MAEVLDHVATLEGLAAQQRVARGLHGNSEERGAHAARVEQVEHRRHHRGVE